MLLFGRYRGLAVFQTMVSTCRRFAIAWLRDANFCSSGMAAAQLDAPDLAAEFVGRFVVKRPAWRPWRWELIGLVAGLILICVLIPMRPTALGLVDTLRELKSRRVSSDTS